VSLNRFGFWCRCRLTHEPAEWRVRSARRSDRRLLASFACADPAVGFEADVEQFIQAQLIDWTFAPSAADDDPRLLLAFVGTTGELFGVAAHERVTLRSSDGTEFNATKLHVAAIATPWQGRRFHIGERASDVLMSAVMSDISARVPPRDARVFGIVHQENQRRIALCLRYGLVEEMSSPDPNYRRLITANRPRTQDSDRP
jgi:hypothetical protein